MMQGKTLILVAVALVIGFGMGFLLRPTIAPTRQAAIAANSGPAAIVASPARSTLYFAANLDEARRVVSGCRADSVRGAECANAERAVTEAEGRDRFKKFTGN